VSAGWPTYYPTGCPPGSAAAPSGDVFRLVRANPPQDDDFVPHIILYPDTDFKKRKCEACGLTVFISRDECRRAGDRIPALRGRLLAVATLNSTHGLLAHTPRQSNPHHHTWWQSASIQAAALFSVAA